MSTKSKIRGSLLTFVNLLIIFREEGYVHKTTQTKYFRTDPELDIYSN